MGIIATLLESLYVYTENIDKTPLSERGDIPIPHLKMEVFFTLRSELEDLKGIVTSIEVPGFNFDLDTTEGGFD